MSEYQTIAESSTFIVLNKYTPQWESANTYQTEDALERELIQDLVNQGYEFVPAINSPDKLLANVRVQLQTLNNVQFTDAEWRRFVNSWLDKPSKKKKKKTHKEHDDYVHHFIFDDEHPHTI